jgi:hypothetical protein
LYLNLSISTFSFAFSHLWREREREREREKVKLNGMGLVGGWVGVAMVEKMATGNQRDAGKGATCH